MSYLEKIHAALCERDEKEKELLPYFEAFQVASRRVTAKSSSSTQSIAEDRAEQEELISRLKQSRETLTKKLITLQSQLDQLQERSRAVAEEQYLKTHVVQGLQDEILALTMQLNLSEEKRKKLQEATGR